MSPLALERVSIEGVMVQAQYDLLAAKMGISKAGGVQPSLRLMRTRTRTRTGVRTRTRKS